MNKFLIYIGAVILPCLVVTLVLIVINQFNINKVIVISLQNKIYGLSILNSQNLLFIDSLDILNRLLENNPSFSSATLDRRYPATLLISTTDRKPVARIVHSATALFLDENGILFSGNQNESNLPLVELSQKIYHMAKIADWRLIKSARLIDYLAKQTIFVDRLYIDDNNGLFSINSKEGSLFIVPFASDVIQVATSLQTIITRFRIEGKFVQKVDLRFEKPIVVVTNGEKS